MKKNITCRKHLANAMKTRMDAGSLRVETLSSASHMPKVNLSIPERRIVRASIRPKRPTMPKMPWD